jgi:hypothetical protein
VATVGIFLPSFFLVVLVEPWFERILGQGRAAGCLSARANALAACTVCLSPRTRMALGVSFLTPAADAPPCAVNAGERVACYF